MAFDFAEGGEQWAWLIRGPGKQIRLFVGGPSGDAREAGAGEGWSSVAVLNGEPWVTEVRGHSGRLLRIKPGSPPEVVLSTAGEPSGSYVHNSQLYWLERTRGAADVLPIFPSLAPSIQLRTPDGARGARTLAEWPSGTDPGSGADRADIIGVAGGKWHLSIPRLASTEFVAVPLAGGEPTRVAIETGSQRGALFQDALCWTGPSMEAASTAAMRLVRCDAPGEPEVVGEWLPDRGSLVGTPDGLYYVADAIYRLPGHRAYPTRLQEITANLAAAAAGKIVLVDPRGAAGPLLVGGK